MASPITKINPRGINTTGDYVVNSLSSTGNVTAGNIKTDNLLYANGSPYAFTTNAAGTNTQIQFNDGNSFAGSANLTFNKTTGTLTVAQISGNGSSVTNVNALTLNGYSDTYFATSTQGGLADSAVQPADLSTVATTGSYTDLIDKPTLFSGNYTDLSNKPTLFDGAYSSLTGAPILANVATTGSYTDLLDKPTLFDGEYASLANKPSLFSGSYVDLTNKPTLGTAAATDATAYATAAQGTKADTALQPADLTGYATESYVTDAIANIPGTDLSSYATQSYVGNAIANLVDSAPTTLDTLNELAAALGDDPNFATSISTSIGSKLATADFDPTADTWLGTKSTSNVSEGTNLYYTVARANTAIDNRVTKTFIDNLAVVANIANVAYSVSGSNVTGPVAYAAIANSVSASNVVGQVANALVSGTVYTNAQPNITSVGTLTSLDVTGNLSAAYVIGNGSQLTGLPAGYTDSNVATYLPTYTGSLTPGNLVVSTSANLGNVANITITGGTDGQVLSTDGNGVLSWTTSASTATSVALDSFTGDGANAAFTLSVSPANVNMITVNYNGSVLLKDSYSIAGNVLTLGSAPFTGSKLEVISITNLAGSGGSGSSGSSYTYSEVTANTTMVASTKYIVDTSTANITLTLPSTGTLGDEISVIDGTGNASAHAITIGRNGGNIQGEASDMTVTTDRAAFTLAYYNATQGWLLTNV